MLLVTTQLVTVLVMFTYLPLAGAILQKKKKKILSTMANLWINK